MKKVLAGLLAVGCFAAAGSALAGIGAGTGVNGSLHDMNVIAGNQGDSMGRVCAFCHTPHHASVLQNGDRLPLWNHTVTVDQDFVPYTWATPNNAETDEGDFSIVDPVIGPSRLCMSCHDGSIAIDEHGSAFAQAGTPQKIQAVDAGEYAGRANLTKNLSDTHPIGFDYNKIATYRNNKTQMGNGAGNPDGTEVVWSSNGYALSVSYNDNQDDGYNTVTRNTGGKLISDNLYKGSIMTCATCHEVHNKENMTQEPYTDGNHDVKILVNGVKTGVPQAAPNYFLYSKQDKSLICLSCHIK